MTAIRRWLVPTLAFFVLLPAVHAQENGKAATPAASMTPTPSTTETPAPETSPSGPKPPKTIWSQVRVHDPYIAMTFDDGPSKALTPRLLDILKARNIHVTFFVVGENAKLFPEILKRAVAEGHEIGNHSWTHPDFAHKPDDFVHSELTRTSDAIEAAIGKRPTLMRPPYGSFTKAQGKWFHDELGFTIVLWDVDPNDWKKPITSETVERRILADTRNGSIILSHDIHATTVEAMPDTFDQLLAKGFKFVTVSELLAMNEPEPPKPSPKPGASVKPHASRPPATPMPTRDPNLPDKINGTAGGT